MATDLKSANGTRVFFGTAVGPDTDTATEFAALTWTEVGLVESGGDFGDESNPVNGTPLAEGRVRKGKGSKDAGMMALTCFHDPSDAGQQALIAAEATNQNYAVKVVLPNRLTTGGTDEINYFRALVMSKRKSVGAVDNLLRRTFNLGINSPIYEVPPT